MSAPDAREPLARIVAELREQLDSISEAAPDAQRSGDGDLDARVGRMAATAGITGDHPPAVRPGRLAPARTAVKGAIRKGTRWYVERLALDVREFAQATIAATEALAVRAVATERRQDETDAALREDVAELRGEIAAARRELGELGEAVGAERREAGGRDRQLAALRDRLTRLERSGPRAAAPAPAPHAVEAPAEAPPAPPIDYYAFEALMRGSREEIAGRQAAYLSVFSDVDDILDAGCGRGEFLQLLRDAGKTAWGVDIDEDMVAQCRAEGLDVERGDAVEALRARPPASLGGVFAAQVVEHLPPPQLVALLEAARAAMRPGGVMVLETINPACLSALRNYFADLSHSQPLIAETLQFLVQSAGFTDVEIRYTSPVPEDRRLWREPGEAEGRTPAGHNVDTLNGLLFGFQDYAVIARA